MATSPHKKILTIVGRVIALLGVIFLAKTFIDHADKLPPLDASKVAPVAIIGIVSYLISGSLSASAWKVILGGAGVHIRVIQAMVVVGKSQIGKYIPGNVMQYANRLALARQMGVSTEQAILSMACETFLLIVTACTLGGLGLLLTGGEFQILLGKIPPWLIQTVAGCGLVAGVLVLFSKKLRQWLLQRRNYLRPAVIMKCMLLYTILFSLAGNVFDLSLKMFAGNGVSINLISLIWGYALAWVIGYVTPGAPGGMGIRELVMFAIFGQQIGPGLAASAVLFLRIITTVTDLINYALATIIERKLIGPLTLQDKPL